MTSLGSQDDFIDNSLRFFWMLLQIITQGFADSLVHGTRYFVITQFGFRLSFELRFSHLDRDDGGQSLTEVIALDFDFRLLQQLGILGIFLQRTRQTTAETGEVRTTFYRVDIIDVRENTFVVGRIIGHGHLDRNALLLRYDMDNILNQFFL